MVARTDNAPTSPPPSASAAGRPARGTSWKGASGVARPSLNVGGSPGRAGSRGSPLHHLLEQLGSHARIGKGAVGVARRLVELDAKPRCRVAQRDAPVAAHVHDRGVKRLQVSPVRRKAHTADVPRPSIGLVLPLIRSVPAGHTTVR